MNEPDGDGTNRRTFLKATLGAVGAASVALPASSAPSPSGRPRDPNDFDVVVIGGGFAGVSAARELCHAGLRTLVLEARSRLGGRTFTAHANGELFELGGTWIHSTQPHVFAEANRYGLELVETTGGFPQRALWWDGSAAKEAGMGEMFALIREAVCASGGPEPEAPLPALQALSLLSSLTREFHAGAAEAFPRPFDPFFSEAWAHADTLSIRDRLDQMELSDDRRGLLEGFVGAMAHGSFQEAGFVEALRWWALSGSDITRYSDSVARYRLREGTKSLIDAMIEDAAPEVRLGTPVSQVSQDAEHVSILTQDGERVTARAVIAALPMNVLANIDFAPALHPDKIAASRERHAGAGVKGYIRVRDELPPIVMFAPESEPLASIMTMTAGASESGGYTELVAFGTDPAKIDMHDKSAVQAALRKFLPDAVVTQTLAYDWHLDPYSLGTWCVLRKGQMSKYLAALREPHGRVHFAGGDIALGWRGFIDGAIESGTRVAREVAAQLSGRGRSPVAAAAHAAQHPGAAEVAFQQCAICHPTDESGRAGVGPNLRGVAGRPMASDPSYAYSQALRSKKGVWTDEELDAFLADPAARAPGTLMPFAGLKDPADRAAVIRFLHKLR
ncbi:MAG: FAD-dependent oxidoreductase [bacterium]|nr:FAD-dependent oxidoreductase [bacterium]